MSAQSSLKDIAGATLKRTTPRTLSAQSKKEAAQYPHIAQNLSNVYIEAISAWLNEIGEPESDHYLVLDKCRDDSEVLAYFLIHANGQLENK